MLSYRENQWPKEYVSCKNCECLPFSRRYPVNRNKNLTHVQLQCVSDFSHEESKKRYRCKCIEHAEKYVKKNIKPGLPENLSSVCGRIYIAVTDCRPDCSCKEECISIRPKVRTSKSSILLYDHFCLWGVWNIKGVQKSFLSFVSFRRLKKLSI